MADKSGSQVNKSQEQQSQNVSVDRGGKEQTTSNTGQTAQDKNRTAKQGASERISGDFERSGDLQRGSNI